MTNNNEQIQENLEITQENSYSDHPEKQPPPCLGRCSNKQILEREAQLRAKGKLIDTMVYHIRTLSNAVIGFSDLLLAELTEEELAGYVQEINGAGQGLSVLANEVLDWTQLLSGELKVTKTKFALSEILNGLERLLSWAAKEKGLDYNIDIDPKLPGFIYTDQERLLKCLVNLTASAIKHTPEGMVRIRVELEWSGNDPYVRFDVIDTGVGLGPDKLDKIFEPTVYRIEMDDEILSQLDRGLTVTTGLPLTWQLSQLLGGTLEAQSQLGYGATFSLRIPAGVEVSFEPESDTSSSIGPSASPDITEGANMEQQHVLLVEDQQSNRTVLTLMLESIGVEIDAVSGGYEAIQKVQDNEYDLILMDLKMPEIDGYETTRYLLDKGVTCPIVALSAKVMNNDEQNQITELFDGFLAKPVDHHNLSEMIKKHSGKNTGAESKTGPELVSKNGIISFD